MLYIIAPMNGSVVVSETHQVVQRKCLDLNERLQEVTIILFYFTLFVSFFYIHLS